MALVRVLELIFETQNPKLGSRGADTKHPAVLKDLCPVRVPLCSSAVLLSLWWTCELSHCLPTIQLLPILCSCLRLSLHSSAFAIDPLKLMGGFKRRLGWDDVFDFQL